MLSNSPDIDTIPPGYDAASAVGTQLIPLLTRVEEALRRSRELLSLPVYPYDPAPAKRGPAGERHRLSAKA